MRKRNGFTLVELLVVVGIIALLLSILLPVLNRARDAANRVKCASNVKQMVAGFILYAQSNTPGWYFYRNRGITGSPVGEDDDLRYMYPKFISDPTVTVCPSTQNRVRMGPANEEVVNGVRYLKDLKDNSRSPENTGGGHSYELRTWMWAGYTFPDGTKPKAVKYSYFDSTAKAWTTTADQDPVRSLKNTVRPERVFLITDADDDRGDSVSINNWPDPNDNHGARGTVVGFADGHAEFVETGRRLMQVFMDSYYVPSFGGSGTARYYGSVDGLYNRFKVQRSGSTFTWMP